MPEYVDVLKEAVAKSVRDFPEHGLLAYSNVTPYTPNAFIDGMAWLSVLCGASHLAKDYEVSAAAKYAIISLWKVGGKDCRNFGPSRVKDNWKESSKYPGIWWFEKPQVSAGPLGLLFCKRVGVTFPTEFQYIYQGFCESAEGTARLLRSTAWAFGWASRVITALQQHTNTYFMTYLALGQQPPSTMKWMAWDNPFYQYVFGNMYTTDWPDWTRYQGHSESGKNVPFNQRKPSPWPPRNLPDEQWVIDQEVAQDTYTPLCELCVYYLHEAMKKEK